MVKLGKYVAINDLGIAKGDKVDVISVDNGYVKLAGTDGMHTYTLTMEDFEYCFSPCKRVWSKWDKHIWPSHRLCNDCLMGDSCSVSDYGCPELSQVECRTNGKVVQVRKAGINAKASCSPRDEFNLETGLKLAMKRLDYKIAQKAILDNYYKFEKEFLGGNDGLSGRK